ncbi:MAG TPA: hypothetical protein VEP90_28330 [Methylomirabilota bacterium]|nr:hypothetical protein [Methylomirabilota bacterium]
MSDSLTKINQLKHIESFIQTNLYKGYIFIDKAGEIINHFYIGDTPPNVPLISPSGMTILKPNNITAELTVAPNAVWEHFLNPNSLDQIATSYSKNLIDIVSILKVDKVTRVGWRNYFVYEYDSIGDREQSLKKFSVEEALKAQAASYSFELKNFISTLSISKISKNDQKQTPAILIDIDTYIVHDKPGGMKEAESELIEIRKAIQSPELLEKINLLIK